MSESELLKLNDICPFDKGHAAKIFKQDVKNAFCKFIDQKDFPCVGAKTALHKSQVKVHTYGDIQCDTNVTDILFDIYQFIEGFDLERDMYSSFVCIFEQSVHLNDIEFESAIWSKLQELHNVDACKYQWDSSVSSDPESNQFSFSLGESAFFVIGLNPNSTRKSRRFVYPAIVFNLHSQFEKLKHEGKFEQFRDHIRERDITFSGAKNNMLATHGEGSEAMQYSGREVSNSWKCPFIKKE